jgi:hypothetical protein
MKRIQKGACAWVLAALAPVALAQAGSQDALLDFMYARFAAVFTQPKGGAGPREFLILASPGIGVDQADLVTPSYAVSMLLDQVPEPARAYHPTGVKVSKVYGRILDAAAITRYQDPSTRGAALAAKAILFDSARPGQPTEAYAAFLNFQMEYQAAQDARRVALAESRATGTPVPTGLDQAVDTARKRWERLGHRQAIQEALDALQAAYAGNALALMRNFRADFLHAHLRGGASHDWLPVTTYPPEEQWTTGTGWHPMTFRQDDPLAPSAGDAGPLPALGKAAKTAAPWTPGMTLSVEVKRVQVTRPWMDPSLFSAHTWALRESAGFTLVSSGNPVDRDPGIMPILVTGLLLARKLTLTGYPGSGADRLGPFDLGGGQGRPAMARHMTRTPAGTVITVPDLQIVAFFCQVVPQSPTPDPRFFR